MTKLSLRLLGPVEATFGEQRIDGFPADKVIALLAYLAVESGVAHPRTSLALLFWPDHPDRKAQGNLRQTLFRLRKTLDNAVDGLSDHLLRVTRRTILLRRDSLWLDVAELQEWSGLCAQQDGSASLERCREAAAVYRGDFMAGLTLRDAPEFDEWQTVLRERSLRQIQDILHILADRYSLVGNYDEAVRLSRRQLHLEPWREEAHRQLMLALARSGHEREALAQYDACRAVLEEEWGGDPSAETTDLYLAIRGRTLSHTAAPAVAAPRSPAQPRLSGFPRDEFELVGRERELDTIRTFYSQPNRRLFTVTGVGGVGKRRLVAEAAAQLISTSDLFADGAHFITTNSAPTANGLAANVASMLSLPIEPSEPELDQLLKQMQGLDTLLVLPNLHSVEEAGGLVEAIISGTAGVRFLSTSLYPLNLPGERTLALSGLDCGSAFEDSSPDIAEMNTDIPTGSDASDRLPGAVQLFLFAARNYRPNFTPGKADLQWIQRICNLVDGVPLALLVAASWTRYMDLPSIAITIQDNGPSFIDAEVRDIWTGRRSLRADFDEEWQHLPVAAQQALAQMSIFRGGAGIQAIYAIVNPDRETLATLVDRGLLQWQNGRRTAIGRQLQEFAYQKLSTGPSLEQATVRRFTSYYLRMVQDADGLLRGAVVDDEWLERIVAELANVRVAWRWTVDGGDLAQAAGVLHSVCLSFERSAHYDEALDMITTCLERTCAWRDDPQWRDNADLGRLYACLLAEKAWFLWRLNHFADAGEAIAESLQQLTGVAPTHDLSFAYLTLGLIEDSRGRYASARDAYAHCLQICEQVGDRMRTGRVLNFLGAVTRIMGEYDEAVRLHEQSLAIGQHLSDRWGIASTLHNLGIDLHRLGHLDRGRAVFQEAIEASRAIDDPWAVNVARISYADLEIDARRLDSARTLLEDALYWAHRTGNLWGEALATTVFGRLDRVAGNPGAAENRLYRALDLWRKVVDDRGTARTLNELGLTELAQQRYTTSAELLYRALDLADQRDANSRSAEILGGLARLFAASGRRQEAARIAAFLHGYDAATGRTRHGLAAIPIAGGGDKPSAAAESDVEAMISFAKQAARQYFPATLARQ